MTQTVQPQSTGSPASAPVTANAGAPLTTRRVASRQPDSRSLAVAAPSKPPLSAPTAAVAALANVLSASQRALQVLVAPDGACTSDWVRIVAHVYRMSDSAHGVHGPFDAATTQWTKLCAACCVPLADGVAGAGSDSGSGGGVGSGAATVWHMDAAILEDELSPAEERRRRAERRVEEEGQRFWSDMDSVGLVLKTPDASEAGPGTCDQHDVTSTLQMNIT